MGGPSAQFKAFQEATSREVVAAGFKWRDKVAGGFTNSGSHSEDKLATLIQISPVRRSTRQDWVNLGLPPGNNASTSSETALNRHGFFLGAGLSPISIRDPMWRRRQRIWLWRGT